MKCHTFKRRYRSSGLNEDWNDFGFFVKGIIVYQKKLTESLKRKAIEC